MKKRQRKYILQQVRKLSEAGLKRATIGRVLKISDPTVRKYQQLQGLPTRPEKRVNASEGLHAALGVVDRAFDSPLSFGAQHDANIAAALLEALVKTYPNVYARATEIDLGQFHGLLTQAIGVKRLCADTATVH